MTAIEVALLLPPAVAALAWAYDAHDRHRHPMPPPPGAWPYLDLTPAPAERPPVAPAAPTVIAPSTTDLPTRTLHRRAAAMKTP